MIDEISKDAYIVKIEYCGSWGYYPKAVSLAETIESKFKKEVAISRGRRGSFEVTINGELIFSKLKEGRFPDESEILVHFQ